jgi:hypothetical protein
LDDVPYRALGHPARIDCMDTSVARSRMLGVGGPRRRPAPQIVRRHREARLELNHSRRPLAADRFAYLKLGHD